MARFCAIVTLMTCLVAMAGCGGDREASAVRNLVVVCIDTVRFDTFFLPERAGIEDELSPYLGKALVYTRAHAPAPWTVPSVVSLLTGLYPAQHGAGRFEQPVANLGEQVPTRLPDGAVTLAERLHRAGFHTGAFVAHPWFRSGYGMGRGFDALHLRKGSDAVLDLGLKWLDAEAGEPFLLYLHFMEAHDRHLQRDRFDEYLAEAAPDVLAAARRQAPAGICEDPDGFMCRRFQVYAAQVVAERRALAELLAALEDRDLLSETAVVVYSDHGEEFHDHREEAERLAGDPRGFYGSGHGQSLYQEQLHVPLVAWHPGLPGQAVEEPTSLVDVAPTLLAWAGVDAPGDAFAGRVVSGSKPGASPFDWHDHDRARWPGMDRRLFASGIAYGPEQIAVLADGWKYVWHEADGRSLLYDLRRDPAEKRPVEEPEVMAVLEPELDRYFDWFSQDRFEIPTLTDEQVEQLKGVGYLQGRDTGGRDDGDEPSDDPGP